MNPQITKLGLESGMLNYVDHETPRHYFLDANADEECLEKFAELIVRECVKLCEHESNDDEYDQYDMGQSVKAENIKTAIKQHFGVEE
jgi:hypothetical protein